MTFVGWDRYKKTPEPLAPYVKDEEVRRAFQRLDLEPTVVGDVEPTVMPAPPGVPTNLRMMDVAYNPDQTSETWYTAETTILWDAPTGDNSEDILGYEVEVKGSSEGALAADDLARYTALLAGSPYDVGLHLMASFIDTGTIGSVPQSFVSGTEIKMYSYMFRIRASNSHGTGGWSGVLSLNGLVWSSVDTGGGDPDATATEPGKVTNVQASKGVGQIDVIWSAPASGGAITGYEVEYQFRLSAGSTVGKSSVSPEHSGTVTSYEHNNLISGEYQYRVRATGPGGEGPYSTYSSWTAIVFVPGKVTGGTASVGDGTTTIAWDEPSGGPVTDYDVEVRTFLSGKYSAWVGVTHVGAARTLIDNAVTNGQKYQYHVRGGNSAGEGPYSDAFPEDGVIPVAVLPVPDKVTGVRVVARDTRVSIFWSAATGGTASDYDVQYRVAIRTGPIMYGGWTEFTHVGTAIATNVTGLTNGSRYQFRVRGGNATGEGEWSDATPADGAIPQVPIPGKVPSGVATAGDTIVTLLWDQPTTGGTVTDYDVQYRFVSQAGNSVWTDHDHVGFGRTTTVSGLTNGVAYQFRVRGGNTGGEGEWSDTFPRVGVVPKIPVPGKVLRVAVVSSGDMIASLSWSDPVGTVTDYDVQYRFVVGSSPGNYGDWRSHTHVGVSSVATVSSLTNGNRYQFRVRGGNSTGEGEWSDPFPSSGVIPVAPAAPGRVTNVQLVPTVNSVAVTWAEPTSGGAITGYDVVYQYRVDTSDRPDDQAVSPAHAGTGESYSHTSLTYGDYKYKVRAKGPGGNGRYSVFSDWESLVSTVPGKVTGVSVSASDASITVTWDAPTTGSPPTGYYVHYRYDDQRGTNYSNWINTTHTGTDRTLTQTVANGRRYQYRVRAYNTAGAGPWSDSTPSSGIVTVAALPVPGKVGRGTVSVGDTTATVYWSAPSGGGTASDYDVQYRSDASGGTSYGNWADHSHVGTALNATVTGLTNLYRYQFRVRGGNATGEGAWSDPMPPDGVVPKIPVPGKVSLVSTTAGNTTVDISWPAPTGIVTDYDVQHRFLVQSGFSIWTDKSHTGTARTSTVSRLTNGVKYQFRVRGGNSTGEGPWSDPFPSGGVIPKLPVPGKVSGGRATPGDTIIDVSWDAPSGTVTDYDLQYQLNFNNTWSQFLNITFVGTARTYHFEGALNGYRHRFRVRGGNSTGEGPWSDGFPSNGVTPRINVPGKVGLVTVAAGDATISLSWANPTGDVTDFDVQYRVDAAGGTSYGNWTDASHNGNSRSFTTVATNLDRYQFRVRGGNGTGEGAWSDAYPSGGAVPKIPVPGKVPTGNTSRSGDRTSITVSWSAPPGPVTDYDIQYRWDTNGGTSYGDWRNFVIGNIRTLTLSSLETGYSYQFHIRAGNSSGKGAWSDAFPSVVAPGKVTGGTVTASDRRVIVSWDAPTTGSDVTSYDVQSRTDNSGGTSYGNWVDISHSDTSSMFERAATNGIRYQYRVRGVNAAGNGAWSDAFPSDGAVPMAPPVPGRVTNVSATMGATTASVTWDAPASGGTVTGYDVQYQYDPVIQGTVTISTTDVSPAHSGTGTSYNHTSLKSGEYRYRVRATGTGGDGRYSAWSAPRRTTVVTPQTTVPDKVTGGAATVGDATYSLSWSEPSGDAATDYDIQYRSDHSGGTNYTAWLAISHTGTSRTKIGTLTNGRRYQFRVRGGNSAGEGAWSDAFPSGGVIPVAVLQRPGTVPRGAAVSTATNITVTWDAPTSGGSVTDYDIRARYKTSGAYGNWYELSHTGISRTTTIGGFSGRTYQYSVRGGNATGEGRYSEAFPSGGVALQVILVPGKVPIGTVDTAGNDRIAIGWSAPSGGAVTDYDVNYRADTSGGTSYGNWIDLSFSGTRRSFSITRSGINDGRYQFRVRGGNAAGEGAWSDAFPEDGGVPGETRTRPGKVSGSSAAAVPRDGSISIAWSAPTSGNSVRDYDIQYRFDNSGGTNYGGWLDIAHDGPSRVRTRPFFNGYRHQFRVRGGNEIGEGPYSDAFPSGGVIPRPAPTRPGKVPVGTAEAGDATITVSWDAPTGTVTDYDVQYRADSSGGTSYGNWIDITHVGTARTFNRSSINGRRYQFRVHAVNVSSVGLYSDAFPTDGVIPQAVHVRPGKVSGGAAAASDASITITWDNPSGSAATGYHVYYRSDSSGGTNYSGWVETSHSGTSRTLTQTVANNRRFQYRVRGYNVTGNGEFSDAFPSAGIIPMAVAPPTPTNGSAVAGDGTVSISWTFTGRVSSFNVQWRTVTVGQAGVVGLTSFSSSGITENTSARTATHPGAVNGTRYQYRVRATFQGSNSAYTQPFPSGGVVPVAIVVVAVPGQAGTPSGVTGNNTVTVSWDAPTDGGDVSSYRLEYQLSSPGSSWTLVSSSIGSGTTSYIHSGLTNGTGYKYRVRAYNDGGNGAWSDTSSVFTPAGVPGKTDSSTMTVRVSFIPGSAGNPNFVLRRCEVSYTKSNGPDDGGSRITNYRLNMQIKSIVAGSTWVNENNHNNTHPTRVYWVTNVPWRQHVRVRILAENANGRGPWSDWVTTLVVA